MFRTATRLFSAAALAAMPVTTVPAHAAGSYRTVDGYVGCSGGEQFYSGQLIASCDLWPRENQTLHILHPPGESRGATTVSCVGGQTVGFFSNGSLRACTLNERATYLPEGSNTMEACAAGSYAEFNARGLLLRC